MIGYISLGTNDLDKAAVFYDALLGEIGATRSWDDERFVVWSISADVPSFMVTKPYDDQKGSVGNGVMIALSADSHAAVDALYAKAIELGASCEGEPGARGDTGFYAAYFRDLDGNKLNVFTFTAAEDKHRDKDDDCC
jgi:predicted lactoylglutathione lyase